MEMLIAIYVQTGVTLLVGGFAVWLYRKQKHDFKKDVAKAILLEVQGGEQVVAKIRDAVRNNNLDIDLSVLQSESWSKNKHLFVRDFDNDEWEIVSEFYNKATLLDDAIRYNKATFADDVEQIRANKQRIFAEYASDVVNDYRDGDDVNAAQKLFEIKSRVFDVIYMSKQDDFAYKPMKYLNDAKMYLEDFPKLTTSSVGTKLKVMSGLSK